MQYIRPGSQYLVPSLLCISSLSLLRNLCLLRKFPNWKGKFSRKSGLHTTASEDYQGRDHEGQSRCSAWGSGIKSVSSDDSSLKLLGLEPTA